MERKLCDSLEASRPRRWSNRILAASLFGILFFTLFPYWLDFSAKHAPGRSPFLLGGPLRFDGVIHTLLNALLFVPFGFALSQFSVGSRRSLLKSLALAVVAGAALSYSIEMIQLYMPSRDSAWDDVLANTFGALLGMVFGLVFGGPFFRKLSESELYLERILSLRLASTTAVIYFALWLAISIPLQQKARLNNWDPNSFLVIGHDVENSTHWSGKVLRVQLWDEALSADQVASLSRDSGRSNRLSASLSPHLLASFDLSQQPPISSHTGLIPNLALKPFTDAPQDVRTSTPAGSISSLVSEASVPAISASVRNSNQVALLVECVPGRGNDKDGAIFGIANLSGDSDLLLWQYESGLVILLRNRLSSRESQLAWQVDGIFTARVRRSIVFSYDGAQGSVYVDGKRKQKSYNFGPGAALVGEFMRLKTDELVAYTGLYDSLVFLPMGFLLGFALRIAPPRNIFYKFCIAAYIILPAVMVEALLAAVSGRSVSLAQVSWSIGLTIAGTLWINLDPSPAK